MQKRHIADELALGASQSHQEGRRQVLDPPTIVVAGGRAVVGTWRKIWDLLALD